MWYDTSTSPGTRRVEADWARAWALGPTLFNLVRVRSGGAVGFRVRVIAGTLGYGIGLVLAASWLGLRLGSGLGETFYEC